MATGEIDTLLISWERLRGAALSNMAKCVRWVHSHTVTEVLETVSFLVQSLSDHCPELRNPSFCKLCHDIKLEHIIYITYLFCVVISKNTHVVTFAPSDSISCTVKTRV